MTGSVFGEGDREKDERGSEDREISLKVLYGECGFRKSQRRRLSLQSFSTEESLSRTFITLHQFEVLVATITLRALDLRSRQ